MRHLGSKKIIGFAPTTFNLAETTRMIEVAKCLQTNYTCLFYGFFNTHIILWLRQLNIIKKKKTSYSLTQEL